MPEQAGRDRSGHDLGVDGTGFDPGNRCSTFSSTEQARVDARCLTSRSHRRQSEKLETRLHTTYGVRPSPVPRTRSKRCTVSHGEVSNLSEVHQVRSSSCPGCGGPSEMLSHGLLAPFVCELIEEPVGTETHFYHCNECDLKFFGFRYTASQMARLY